MQNVKIKSNISQIRKSNTFSFHCIQIATISIMSWNENTLNNRISKKRKPNIFVQYFNYSTVFEFIPCQLYSYVS